MIPLPEKHAAEAGRLLARALWDDPLTLFVYPDADERIAAFPLMVTNAVTARMRDGEVWTTAGAMQAVAVWLPPDWRSPSEEAQAAARDALVRVASPSALDRLGRVSESLGEASAALLRDEPHWCLAILGVEPALQGEGRGGHAIANVLARADADAIPSYLETFTAGNVRFYGRHGFEVNAEWDIPDGGPHVWTMRRRPAPRR